jgi:hypothetical protein
MGQQLRHLVEPRQDVGRLEQLLLLGGRNVEIGGRKIGQQAGEVVASMVWRNSGAPVAAGSNTSRTWPLSTRKRASTSEPVSVGSAMCRPRAIRNGWPSTKSLMRKRWTPWQTRWWPPSGVVT